MKSSPIPTALAALCLTACASPSSAPPPQAPPIPPSLTWPCRPHVQRPLQTWGDLAQDYAETLADLQDCAARHRALSDAVRGQRP